MTATLEPYLHGALTFGCLVAGLKFLRFWRVSRDRFFIWFAVAFAIFAAEWCLRAFAAPTGHLAYVPRLLGFVLILTGIIDKNRRAR